MPLAALLQFVHPFARAVEPAAAKEAAAETARETIDQLLYSFVLLILARALLIEPFVIPTGSMAPTLYGRHKDCECPSCGLDYEIGASCEVNEGGSVLLPNTRITLSPCPNCRHPTDVTDAMAFNGDHVVVNKWAFRLGETARGDVFVFKFPQEPNRNYIKRLMGLPNETLRIRGGDLYRLEDGRERIVRLDSPRKRRAASVLVHDSEYPSPALLEAGWPRRWSGEGWTPGEGGTFSRAASPEPATLTYAHLVPDGDDWRAVLDGRPVDPRPQLVSDYCPYNSYTGTGQANVARRVNGAPSFVQVDTGIYWTPDLAVEMDLTLDGATDGAEVLLEIVEGVHRWRCRIDADAGRATLSRVNVQQDPDEDRPLAEAAVSVRGDGTYRLRFANVNDELSLWVGDTAVDFGDGALIDRDRLDNSLPTPADLRPISITVAGAAAVVDRLSVRRDLYYRVIEKKFVGLAQFEAALTARLRDPEAYARLLATADERLLSMELTTGEGEYLALGDNSPQSRDGREWGAVPESHLVGKAFYTYWPHGVPFLNGGRGFALRHHLKAQPMPGGAAFQKVKDYPRYTVPFYPNFERMTRIR